MRAHALRRQVVHPLRLAPVALPFAAACTSGLGSASRPSGCRGPRPARAACAPPVLSGSGRCTA
eukprot:15123515-Alexandrium_andersonii.AAC.1